MSVSTAYAPLTFSGNGSTTAFSVTWPFYTGSLVVTLISSTGVETTQTISTHYTVSGGTLSNGLPSTGTVTMLTAPATGQTLRITRNTPKTQAAVWTNSGSFQAKTLESALDKLTLISQEGGDPGTIFDGMTGDVIQLNSSGAVNYWDGENQILRNLADPTEAQDAMTKAYGDANYGGAAAIAAAASASSAASSAISAAAAADEAEQALTSLLTSSFATKAAAEAYDPIIAPTYLILAGHTDEGDAGGGIYRRVVSEPTHAGKLQIAEGSWYELKETVVTPQMFGAKGDGATDDATAFNNAFTYADQKNASVFIPQASYGVSTSPTAKNIFIENEQGDYITPWFGPDYVNNLAAVRSSGRTLAMVMSNGGDATPASAGQNVLTIQATCLDSDAAQPAQKNALYARIATQDPHTGAVAFQAQAVIRNGVTSEAWGAHSWVECTSGSNGYMVAHEFEVHNNGASQTLTDQSDSKYILHAVAKVGLSTAGLKFSNDPGATMQYGIYGATNTFVDSFIRLANGTDNRWRVAADGVQHWGPSDDLSLTYTTGQLGWSGGKYFFTNDGNANNFDILTVTNTNTGSSVSSGARWVAGTSAAVINLRGSGTATPGLFSLYTAQASDIRFGTNAVDRLALVHGGNLVPVANDGLGLGTSALGFSDLALASGGVIQWTTDVYITHSASLLAFTGADNGYTFDAQVRTNGTVALLNSSAPSAGGTTGAGLLMSSTASFGVFFGSGAPSLTAAKGSLYLRTDGSTTNDRIYVNTGGAWTAIITAT